MCERGDMEKNGRRRGAKYNTRLQWGGCFWEGGKICAEAVYRGPREGRLVLRRTVAGQSEGEDRSLRGSCFAIRDVATAARAKHGGYDWRQKDVHEKNRCNRVCGR